MSADDRRVRIQCPKCNAFVVSAPIEDLPTGDLVCPNCGVVFQGPSQVDRLLEIVGRAIKGMLKPSSGRDKPE